MPGNVPRTAGPGPPPNLTGPVVYPAQRPYKREVLATAGLVGYWRLGEPSGTVAEDLAGSNDGLYQNTPTLGATGALSGDTDKAVTFTAASSEDVLLARPFTSTDDVALEVWVKLAALTSQQTMFLFVGNDAGGYGVGISDGGGGSGLKLVTLLGGIAWLDSGYTFADTNFHHVVATRESGTWKWYVDGVQTANTSVTAPLSPNNQATIASGGGLRYFDGTIDEAAVYNAPLTSSQALAHYLAAPVPAEAVLSEAVSPGGATAAGVTPVAVVATATGGSTVSGNTPSPRTTFTAGGATTGGNPPAASTVSATGGATAGGNAPAPKVTFTAGGATGAGNAPSARTTFSAGGLTSQGTGPAARITFSPGGALLGGRPPSESFAGGDTVPPGGSVSAGYGPSAAVGNSTGGAAGGGSGPGPHVTFSPGGVVVDGRAPSAPDFGASVPDTHPDLGGIFDETVTGGLVVDHVRSGAALEPTRNGAVVEPALGAAVDNSRSGTVDVSRNGSHDETATGGLAAEGLRSGTFDETVDGGVFDDSPSGGDDDEQVGGRPDEPDRSGTPDESLLSGVIA